MNKLSRFALAVVLAVASISAQASFILTSRVWETFVTIGAGPFDLSAGAQLGYRSFSSAMSNGDTIWCTISNRTVTAEWESGICTWHTGNTISITTVLDGSNGTSAVVFSAGTKDIFSDLPPKVLNFSGAATLSSSGVVSLASTITAGGPTGGATTVPVITYNAAGQLTAVTTAAITNIPGNAATATALAADPADCSANQFAHAINASGTLTCSSVANAATTATNANTASTIVARDASGNFSAGTITAALTGTASGNITASSSDTLTNKTLTNPGLTVQVLPVTTTSAWNLASGNMGTAALVNSITTLTVTNPPAGATVAFKITQGGTGSYTIAWPASFKWAGGTAPTLSTAVGKIDLITCATFDTGTSYQCASTLDVR